MDIPTIINLISTNYNFKDSTISYYTSTLNRILRDCYDKFELSLSDFNDYNKFFTYIDSLHNNSEKKNFLNVFIKIYKCIDKHDNTILNIYLDKFKKIALIADSDRELTTPSNKESKQFISFDNILLKWTNLKNKLTDSYKYDIDIKFLILSLYLFLPPLRSQDYINTKILSSHFPNNENYIHDNKLIINDHKTVKKYGPKSITIPPNLLAIISSFHSKSNSIWLLPSRNGASHLSNSNLSHKLSSIIGCSVLMLRKIFISKIIDDKLPIPDRKQIASIMGHSIYSQSIIYSKFSNITHNKS